MTGLLRPASHTTTTAGLWGLNQVLSPSPAGAGAETLLPTLGRRGQKTTISHRAKYSALALIRQGTNRQWLQLVLALLPRLRHGLRSSRGHTGRGHTCDSPTSRPRKPSAVRWEPSCAWSPGWSPSRYYACLPM